MLDVTEIMEAIENLPEKEYSLLRQWFVERDQQRWDKQIELDSASKKLDFLVKEALDEKSKGYLDEV